MSSPWFLGNLPPSEDRNPSSLIPRFLDDLKTKAPSGRCVPGVKGTRPTWRMRSLDREGSRFRGVKASSGRCGLGNWGTRDQGGLICRRVGRWVPSFQGNARHKEPCDLVAGCAWEAWWQGFKAAGNPVREVNGNQVRWGTGHPAIKGTWWIGGRVSMCLGIKARGNPAIKATWSLGFNRPTQQATLAEPIRRALGSR